MFSGCLEQSKIIIASLLSKQNMDMISLDKSTEESLIKWSQEYILLREHLKNLNNGTKFH